MAIFKKSDSNEIERTLSIIICLIIILIPAGTVAVNWFGAIHQDWVFYVTVAELALFTGGSILLLFDIMYLIKKENRFFCVYDLLIVLSIASILISTLFAEDTQTAIAGTKFNCEGAPVLISYLIIMYSVSLIDNDKYRKWIYLTLTVFGLFEAFMGFMQTAMKNEFFLGDWAYEGTPRAYGTLTNQNPYGQLMAMFACIECAMMFLNKDKRDKIIHGLLFFIYSWCLFASGTRGAMVGFAVALIYMLFLFIKRYSFSKKKILIYLGVILLFGIVVLGLAAIFNGGLYSNIISRFKDDLNSVSSASDNSSSIGAFGNGRLGIWIGSLKNFFFEKPIFGVGISNIVMKHVEGFSVYIAYVSHNEYIDILGSQGIVGFIIYLALVVYTFIYHKKAAKKSKADMIFTPCIIAVVSFLIADIFGWHIIYLTPYFYMIWGFCFKRRGMSGIKWHKK